LQSSTLGYIWKLDEIDRDAIQRLADILADAGVVEEDVDTTNWYYLSVQISIFVDTYLLILFLICFLKTTKL